MCGDDCTVGPQTYMPTLPGCERLEVAQRLGAAVVEADGHLASLAARP